MELLARDGESMPKPFSLGRRAFLSTAAAAASALTASSYLFPVPALAGTGRNEAARRWLSFVNVNTGEGGQFTYWENGEFDPQSLARINHLMRDHKVDQETQISTDLLDLLVRLRQKLNSDHAFEIISAFRSETTNDCLRDGKLLLRTKSRG